MDETPLERRRARVNAIRARIAAGSIALFIAVFAGIGVQLMSGHDPALAAKSTKSTTSTPTSTTSTSTTGTGSTGSDNSAQQQPAKSLSPVTTSQS